MQETHPMNLMTNLLQSVGDFKAALQEKACLPWAVLKSKTRVLLVFF